MIIINQQERMPVSKKTTSSKLNKSDRLIFAETLENFGTSIEKLLSNVDMFENYKREKITEFEIQRETKNKDLEDLEKEFKMRKIELEKQHEVLKKDQQIACDQNLEEYKNKAILEFLSERDEVQIKIEDLEALNEELSDLRQKGTDELEECKKSEREKHSKELRAALTNLELKHKAESACLKASVDQKDNEITSLQKSIDNLNREIGAQRELTNQIAQSMKQAPITQTFGK